MTPSTSKRLPAWARWESVVQQALGLKSTIGSGNQFHDPSDGRTAEHYTEHPRPLMVDAKHTELKSYTLTKKDLGQWVKKAALFGCRFGLPIRFESDGSIEDYIVVPFEDYEELYTRHVSLARRGEARTEALMYLQGVCDRLKDEGVRAEVQRHLLALGEPA